MITFRHNNRDISLREGDTWVEKPTAETYRDTAASDVETVIARIKSGTPWRQAVSDRFSVHNPWLASIVTSPRRDLFFRQHPPAVGSTILDIGAGWGQAALPLARLGKVVALEPTAERLDFIRAAAQQDGLAGRLYFVQGDFFEVEFQTRFDLICCIGVLEWTPKFRAGDPVAVQTDFLQRARRCLKPGGRLVIGIENRLGLKYILGAPDDHVGKPGVLVYDAALATRKWRAKNGSGLRVLTHSRAELGAMLGAAGFNRADFFAAFPDYKLPEVILPLGPAVNDFFSKGGYVTEHDGSSGKPLDFQEELASHYRSFAQLGVAQEFVPSFFVTAFAP